MNGNYLLTWLYCCARLAGMVGGGRKAGTTGRMDSGHAQLFDIDGGKAESGKARKRKPGLKVEGVRVRGLGGEETTADCSR